MSTTNSLQYQLPTAEKIYETYVLLVLVGLRARARHYSTNAWPPRENAVPGRANIHYEPIVSSEKIILPPLHVKLGLFKNFVKGLDKDGEPMAVLKGMFPKLSIAKLNDGVFVGPDTRKIMQSQEFMASLNAIERRAFQSLIRIVENFLGKHRSPDYKVIVTEILTAFEEMGINMSLKIHMLKNHLDFFQPDMGKITDEHGERFHQTIANIEKRYQGRADARMLADFCWSLDISSN